MRHIKQIAALIAALALALALSACSGNSAPDKYSLADAGIELDSLTKVVGARNYSDGSTGSSEIKANYTGVENVQSDLDAYHAYLESQGFVDYFGLDGVRMAMVLRRDDSAVLVSATSDADALTLTVSWREQLELMFGDTQYVSGTSLAILPSSDMVVFEYPVMGEQLATQSQVDQLILDGVNQMIQYAAELAAGQPYKLNGDYELTSRLASNVTVNLTGTLTVGESEYALSSSITITGILDAPVAQYTPVTAQ